MSPGSLQGVAASAALAAGVSLMTILQAGDWTRVLHQLGTVCYLHYYYGSAPGLHAVCLAGPQ